MSTMTAPAHAPVRAPRPVERPRPAEGPARRSDHLRVVRPDEQVRRRLTPKAGVVLTVLLFGVLLAVAGAQSLLVQAQVRLDAVDKQLAAEQDRYQALRKDLAEMESPERIVAAAQAQGMVTPSDLVYLQPDDATGAPEDEGPASGELARSSQGRWSDVKPLLEAPTP
ncbi:MAG: hypothetical protein Q8K72_11860 [Acidimicrobiales bacterium]|nr:hypothetical protein [Acidimicrobiales bacterium]